MTPVYEEHPPDGRCELIAHVGVPYEERGSATSIAASNG